MTRFSTLDSSVSTGCCATLDHIVTYLFQQLQKASKSSDAQKEVEKHPALKIIELQPNMLQQVCIELEQEVFLVNILI